MLPTKIDANTYTTLVANIIAKYVDATARQQQAGAEWYRNAHKLALELDPDNVVRAAGVIAALSVQKSWADNVKLARQAYATGVARGHTSDNCRKAQAILDGQHPASVLPMNAKTGNFYRCIANPDDTHAVCIDRHAHDIAVGEVYGAADRGLSNPTRYGTIARAYRDAARILSIPPATLQAITWVTHVESLANVSNRGERYSATATLTN